MQESCAVRLFRERVRGRSDSEWYGVFRSSAFTRVPHFCGNGRAFSAKSFFTFRCGTSVSVGVVPRQHVKDLKRTPAIFGVTGRRRRNAPPSRDGRALFFFCGDGGSRGNGKYGGKEADLCRKRRFPRGKSPAKEKTAKFGEGNENSASFEAFCFTFSDGRGRLGAGSAGYGQFSPSKSILVPLCEGVEAERSPRPFLFVRERREPECGGIGSVTGCGSAGNAGIKNAVREGERREGGVCGSGYFSSSKRRVKSA